MFSKNLFRYILDSIDAAMVASALPLILVSKWHWHRHGYKSSAPVDKMYDYFNQSKTYRLSHISYSGGHVLRLCRVTISFHGYASGSILLNLDEIPARYRDFDHRTYLIITT